jgi:DNA-binding LacI/PurR family transcriptional regulator/biotin operon repressor
MKKGRRTMLRYKEIKNMLAAEIAKLKSNDRLPSRDELCKKLDAARATIDKAINELVAEGELYSRGGSGTYVVGSKEELSAQSSGCNWGVIVRDVRESYYAETVRGVENVAQSYGINTILCNSDSDFDKQEQYIKRLINSGVSGIIIVPIVSPDVQENYRLFSQLTELKIPFVFCNRNAEGINAPMVASNDFHGGYIAAKHLLEKGYRNIAYISHQKFRTSVDRCQGYITALMDHGIEVNQKLIVIEEKSQTQPYGYEAMQKILVSGQQVDAVFCFNDKVTQGVYQAIAEAGLRVSDDIGVVGYDNTEICEKPTPAVTSIVSKNLEIGTKAAEVLYKLINKEDLSDFHFYLFQTDIVVRESCLGLK